MNLVTSLQFFDDARATPEIEPNKNKEINTVNIVPFRAPTTGTNNALLYSMDKVFSQETLTKKSFILSRNLTNGHFLGLGLKFNPNPTFNHFLAELLFVGPDF